MYDPNNLPQPHQPASPNDLPRPAMVLPEVSTVTLLTVQGGIQEDLNRDELPTDPDAFRAWLAAPHPERDALHIQQSITNSITREMDGGLSFADACTKVREEGRANSYPGFEENYGYVARRVRLAYQEELEKAQRGEQFVPAIQRDNTMSQQKQPPPHAAVQKPSASEKSNLSEGELELQIAINSVPIPSHIKDKEGYIASYIAGAANGQRTVMIGYKSAGRAQNVEIMTTPSMIAAARKLLAERQAASANLADKQPARATIPTPQLVPTPAPSRDQPAARQNNGETARVNAIPWRERMPGEEVMVLDPPHIPVDGYSVNTVYQTVSQNGYGDVPGIRFTKLPEGWTKDDPVIQELKPKLNYSPPGETDQYNMVRNNALPWAPRRLVYTKNALGLATCLGIGMSNRVGNYAVEIKVGDFPVGFSGEAIHMWHSDKWDTRNVSTEPQHIDYWKDRRNIAPEEPLSQWTTHESNQFLFDRQLFTQHFPNIVEQALLLRPGETLCIQANNEHVATYIRCLLEATGQDYTFSTYEESFKLLNVGAQSSPLPQIVGHSTTDSTIDTLVPAGLTYIGGSAISRKTRSDLNALNIADSNSIKVIDAYPTAADTRQRQTRTAPGAVQRFAKAVTEVFLSNASNKSQQIYQLRVALNNELASPGSK